MIWREAGERGAAEQVELYLWHTQVPFGYRVLAELGEDPEFGGLNSTL